MHISDYIYQLAIVLPSTVGTRKRSRGKYPAVQIDGTNIIMITIVIIITTIVLVSIIIVNVISIIVISMYVSLVGVGRGLEAGYPT
jgi:hypothetical protein